LPKNRNFAGLYEEFIFFALPDRYHFILLQNSPVWKKGQLETATGQSIGRNV
jgi:hypothetical protein